MQIRATTCRNVVRGKATFLLHGLGRRGERAVRRRSLVIKELPRSTLPLVFLATRFGPFCKVFAGHQPFAADTVGAENVVTSCDLRVLVDQSAEPITPQDADVGA
jgi:hypothetical protein